MGMSRPLMVKRTMSPAATGLRGEKLLLTKRTSPRSKPGDMLSLPACQGCGTPHTTIVPQDDGKWTGIVEHHPQALPQHVHREEHGGQIQDLQENLRVNRPLALLCPTLRFFMTLMASYESMTYLGRRLERAISRDSKENQLFFRYISSEI